MLSLKKGKVSGVDTASSHYVLIVLLCAIAGLLWSGNISAEDCGEDADFSICESQFYDLEEKYDDVNIYSQSCGKKFNECSRELPKLRRETVSLERFNGDVTDLEKKIEKSLCEVQALDSQMTDYWALAYTIGADRNIVTLNAKLVCLMGEEEVSLENFDETEIVALFNAAAFSLFVAKACVDYGAVNSEEFVYQTRVFRAFANFVNSSGLVREEVSTAPLDDFPEWMNADQGVKKLKEEGMSTNRIMKPFFPLTGEKGEYFIFWPGLAQDCPVSLKQTRLLATAFDLD